MRGEAGNNTKRRDCRGTKHDGETSIFHCSSSLRQSRFGGSFSLELKHAHSADTPVVAAVNVKMRHNKYYQLLGHLRTGAARFLVVGPLAHAVAAVGISESQLVHVHLGDSVGFSQ